MAEMDMAKRLERVEICRRATAKSVANRKAVAARMGPRTMIGVWARDREVLNAAAASFGMTLIAFIHFIAEDIKAKNPGVFEKK